MTFKDCRRKLLVRCVERYVQALVDVKKNSAPNSAAYIIASKALCEDLSLKRKRKHVEASRK